MYMLLAKYGWQVCLAHDLHLFTVTGGARGLKSALLKLCYGPHTRAGLWLAFSGRTQEKRPDQSSPRVKGLCVETKEYIKMYNEEILIRILT